MEPINHYMNRPCSKSNCSAHERSSAMFCLLCNNNNNNNSSRDSQSLKDVVAVNN